MLVVPRKGYVQAYVFFALSSKEINYLLCLRVFDD